MTMRDFEGIQEKFQSIAEEMDESLYEYACTLEKLNGAANLDHFMPQLIKDIYAFHNRMESLTHGCSKEELAVLKQIYRLRLNKYWGQGNITNRCLTKPQGYHGDYITMQLMYENQFRGETNLGKCLHKFVTDDPSSASVRARRHYLKDRIKLIFNYRGGNILSVASGPATEIVDALIEGINFKRITLLDQDYKALKEAEGNIREVLPKNTELVLLNITILDLILNGDEDLKRYGPYNYIYSAGLYDYLPNEFASKLNHYLYDLLSETGTLDIGNFTEFSIGFFADFASGWRLILRESQEMVKILPQGLDIEFNRVNDQTFATVTRSGAPQRASDNLLIQPTGKPQRESNIPNNHTRGNG